MFLNHTSKQRFNSKQQGLSLPILLFILIVLGLLATALFRITSQTTAANAQQVISTRAFFAAESGANAQALRLFPVNGGATVCAPITLNFTAAGLNGCSATTSCTPIVAAGTTYYQVQSQGQCNAGQTLQATRTIEVRLQALN